jgi:Protein of unknown function (DUF642)
MGTRNGIIKSGVLLVIGLGLSQSARAQNLITNGGFETGNFSGWTVTGDPDYSKVVGFSYGYFHPESGKYYAMLGSVGSESYLSQTVPTTPGGNYDVSFDLASDGGANNQLSVEAGSDMLLDVSNIPASGYTLYSEDFVATASATTISIGTEDDPGYLLLDNVSVVDPPAAPLPSPLIMSGLLIAGWAGFRRIRKPVLVQA